MQQIHMVTPQGLTPNVRFPGPTLNVGLEYPSYVRQVIVLASNNVMNKSFSPSLSPPYPSLPSSWHSFSKQQRHQLGIPSVWVLVLSPQVCYII